MTREAILEVRELRAAFDVKRLGRKLRLQAVDGGSLSLGEGEVLGIVGESGCGKTTVGRSIIRLSPVQGGAIVFKGTDVLGSDNQKIGDVSDILFDKNGKIDAYVVSVGGFLGIGSKEVALAPTAFQVVPPDPNSVTDKSSKLKTSMTKDQLKEAANFEPYKEPRATTGAGGAPRPSGSSGGMTK